MKNATLSGSNFFMTDFSAADLTKAEINAVDLTNSVFVSTKLDYVSFQKPDIFC